MRLLTLHIWVSQPISCDCVVCFNRPWCAHMVASLMNGKQEIKWTNQIHAALQLAGYSNYDGSVWFLVSFLG